MGIRRIYLDTCIVIYFIEKHPSYSTTIEYLLSSLSVKDIVCYSPLIRFECLIMPIRTNNPDLQNHYELFFKAQECLEMTSEVFEKSAKLRADNIYLKTPDALHLATALHYECDEFWTNDDRLFQIAPKIVRNISLK